MAVINNELPDVNYFTRLDSIEAAMERRRFQLKNHKFKLAKEKAQEAANEDDYYLDLATTAAANIRKHIPRPFLKCLSNLLPPLNRSKTALYQMSASYQVPNGEELELIFSMQDSRKNIEAGAVAAYDISIDVNHPHFTMPRYDDSEIMDEHIEGTIKRSNTKSLKLNITSLVDISLLSIEYRRTNDKLRDQFKHDLILNFARECAMWHKYNKETEHANMEIVNKLAEKALTYYDGIDETTGRAYINTLRIYIKGFPTDWWIHSNNDRTLIEGIRAGNGVNIYGKRGCKVKMIIPDATETTLLLEKLTDQYLMQRFNIGNGYVLFPPGISTPLIQNIVEHYERDIIPPPLKPTSPSIDAITEQGYHTGENDAAKQAHINRIRHYFLNEDFPNE